MFYSFKCFYELLFISIVIQFIAVDTQATTVSELLDIFNRRQLSIQDYNFIVSGSFFIHSLQKNEVDVMSQKHFENITNQFSPLNNEELERKFRLVDLSASSLSRSKFTGSLFQMKGIGLTTYNYIIYTSGDPQDEQLANIILSSSEESNSKFREVPEPRFKFGQFKSILPEFVIDVFSLRMRYYPSSFQNDSSKGLLFRNEELMFNIPAQATVTIEDRTASKKSRYSCFPFWHEEILRFANENNTKIVKYNDEEIELLITEEKSPQNLSFSLFCDLDGRINRYIKKSNKDTLLVADFFDYAVINPEGIEIPQSGRMWIPASRLDTAYPMPEVTRFCSILNGTINSGMTLDNLTFDVPVGTTIVDHRMGRKPGTYIVTTGPIRLGANLPDDISKLNESDQ